MCVVSMVMDHYYDKWRPYRNPWRVPYDPINPYTPVEPSITPIVPMVPTNPPIKMPTQEEIDDFRRLYERAKEYDKTHNQPDCELEEKKQKLLKLAEELGIKDKVKFL